MMCVVVTDGTIVRIADIRHGNERDQWVARVQRSTITCSSLKQTRRVIIRGTRIYRTSVPVKFPSHNTVIFRESTAWTKWETSNIEGWVIQRRNERAQEPCVTMVYLGFVTKPCIVDGLQLSVRIS